MGKGTRDRCKKDLLKYCETARLKTFTEEWDKLPMPTVSKELLAECGFRYLGPFDRTACVFCGGVMQGWEHFDDPTLVHDYAFPWCFFANYKENTFMGKYSDRLKSFAQAPFCLSALLKQRFARAGFHSIGTRDHIKCFDCKLVLQDINYNECIFAQHAFWSPECSFILNRKGHKFVEDVVKNGRIKNSRYESYAINEIGISSISREINNEILRHYKKEECALQQKLESLKIRYEKLKDTYEELLGSKQCIICCDKDRDTLIMPCRHLVCCSVCLLNLDDKCPVCKGDIVMQIKAFIS